MIYTVIELGVGEIMAAASDDQLCHLWFADQKYAPDRSGWRYRKTHPFLSRVERQLQCYVAGTLKEFNLPLATSGTIFQKSVWNQLRLIPHGELRSYSEIAGALGQPKAYRAVASAIAKNPLIVVIPCHRVVGRNGNLTGFSAGVERKRQLLEIERSNTCSTSTNLSTKL